MVTNVFLLLEYVCIFTLHSLPKLGVPTVVKRKRVFRRNDLSGPSHEVKLAHARRHAAHGTRLAILAVAARFHDCFQYRAVAPRERLISVREKQKGENMR